MKKEIVLLSVVAIIFTAGAFAAGFFASEYFERNSVCLHEYEIVVIRESNCIERGEQHWVCAKCGYVKDKDYLAPLGHEYSRQELIAPTHDSDGCLTEIKCVRCGLVDQPAIILNRLRYVVVCMSLKSAGMMNGFVDIQYNLTLNGNSPIFVGGVSDDKYLSEIENVEAEKRNCCYCVFETSEKEFATLNLSVDNDCRVEWYIGDRYMGIGIINRQFLVPEADSVHFVRIYSREKLYTITGGSNVLGHGFGMKFLEGDSYADGYYEGTKLEFVAYDIEGYVFYCWLSNGEAVSASQTFVLDGIKQNQNLTAVYKKLSKLSVVCGYGGSAYISDDQGASDGETEIVQAIEDRTYYLFAKADDGYEFAGWYDGNEYIGNDLPQEYLMSKTAKTLTAKFIKKS